MRFSILFAFISSKNAFILMEKPLRPSWKNGHLFIHTNTLTENLADIQEKDPREESFTILLARSAPLRADLRRKERFVCACLSARLRGAKT
jgi:hypothetical protein